MKTVRIPISRLVYLLQSRRELRIGRIGRARYVYQIHALRRLGQLHPSVGRVVGALGRTSKGTPIPTCQIDRVSYMRVSYMRFIHTHNVPCHAARVNTLDQPANGSGMMTSATASGSPPAPGYVSPAAMATMPARSHIVWVPPRVRSGRRVTRNR